MSLDAFIHQVTINWTQQRKDDDTLRFGQVFFNTLHGYRPALADGLRGTPMDPFYKDALSNDTMEWLQERW